MSLYLINLDWWVAYYQMQALQFVATAALIAGLVAFALDQMFGAAHTIKAVKPKSQNYKDLQEFAVLIVAAIVWTAWWHGKEFKG